MTDNHDRQGITGNIRQTVSTEHAPTEGWSNHRNIDDPNQVCYPTTSSIGEAVWKHSDVARFWDSHAGAGPRSTPTLSNGLVYSFGATGILNVMDAGDATLVWSRNIAGDTQAEIPEWGFCSSPLVTMDVVIVALAGTLIACDISTGDQRWRGEDGGKGYSSPHLLEIDGVPQVLLMNDPWVVSISPKDGKLLWEYSWPHSGRILQPAMASNGDILLSTGGSKGMCRLKVERDAEGWNIQERWKAVVLILQRESANGKVDEMMALQL